jgi:hypothetical protein
MDIVYNNVNYSVNYMDIVKNFWYRRLLGKYMDRRKRRSNWREASQILP